MAAKKTTTIRMSKNPRIPEKQYFRIGDVAELAGVKPYVLRYWESEFPMISPRKSSSVHRVYRRADVETVLMIKHLLYDDKYSIQGARKRISSLRKDGTLKSFREEKAEGHDRVEEGAVTPGLRVEKIEKLRELSRELKALANLPISRLFHL
jgi:DNA-binding transcriptional MerR regulator